MSEATSEPLTGRAGIEAAHGYEPRTPAPEPDQKTYGPGDEGIREAANDHTAERGATTEGDLTKLSYRERPHDRLAVTPEQAATDLSAYHREKAAAAEADDLESLARQVDEARAIVYGQEPLATQPQAEQPQAASPDTPQPETSEVGEQPSGLSPKMQAFLADPEIRSVVESEYGRINAAEEAYRSAIAQNAAIATQYALSQIEELSGLSLEQASQALAIMDQKDPQRAFAIRQQLQAPAQMLAEAQRAQQAHLARQQQEAAVRLNAFRNEQDQKILKTRPELKDRAVAKKYMDAAPTYLEERGFSRGDLEALMAGRSGVAIFDARMQDILIDALKYREAMAGIAQPPTKPIPQVQKPGNGISRADRSAAQIGDIAREFRNAKGNRQLELAVKLQQAKRAARG